MGLTALVATLACLKVMTFKVLLPHDVILTVEIEWDPR